MKNCRLNRRLLSKMNSFDYNSMKLRVVTLLSTIMSSNFRMAHIASCLQELLPFVDDNSLFIRILQKRGHLCPMDTFLV